MVDLTRPGPPGPLPPNTDKWLKAATNEPLRSSGICPTPPLLSFSIFIWSTSTWDCYIAFVFQALTMEKEVWKMPLLQNFFRKSISCLPWECCSCFALDPWREALLGTDPDHVTDPITDLTNPHSCRPAPESSAIIADVVASQPPLCHRLNPGHFSKFQQDLLGISERRKYRMNEWERIGLNTESG